MQIKLRGSEMLVTGTNNRSNTSYNSGTHASSNVIETGWGSKQIHRSANDAYKMKLRLMLWGEKMLDVIIAVE
ncbi:hypothetical protein [Paenibacillus monticola]|uniref:Uncharacterized protein n=1 Tax=Paenibacillus monticola TaxID=2666075 RepID=A0A7X2H8C9_9BACL|nr:hypothetical protein [Paenibacillus monticola]MRN55412.1 hypothetical protein [Paenibacillus monticola]